MINFISYFYKEKVYVTFYVKDLNENIISFEFLKIKTVFPIDFNVNLMWNKSGINSNFVNYYDGLF